MAMGQKEGTSENTPGKNEDPKAVLGATSIFSQPNRSPRFGYGKTNAKKQHHFKENKFYSLNQPKKQHHFKRNNFSSLHFTSPLRICKIPSSPAAGPSPLPVPSSGLPWMWLRPGPWRRIIPRQPDGRGGGGGKFFFVFFMFGVCVCVICLL